jgi:glycosyltransferase involved in cell wall biosynthesis
LVILWDYYQHYHLARLGALTALGQREGWIVQPLAAGRHGASADCHEIAAADPQSAPMYLGGEDDDLNSPSVARRLWQELDRGRPDAVMFPGYGFRVSRAALRWCRRNRRGAVMMFESQEKDSPRSWVRELAKSLVVGRADCAFCGGRAHAAYAARLGMPAGRIFLKYSVVDNDFWREGAEAARAGVAAGAPHRFLAAGRFVPKKNFAGLVETFGRFKQQDPDGWRLVLVGDGPEGDRIRAVMNRWNLRDLVDLPGYLGAAEIAHWMGRSDVFVMPSLQGEQWGLAVNEAMAAGLPAIVSEACGCVDDLVEDGVTGLRIEPSSLEQLVAAMRRLAGSAGLRATLARGGRTRIAAYSVGEFAGQALAACARSTEIARSRPCLRLPFLS